MIDVPRKQQKFQRDEEKIWGEREYKLENRFSERSDKAAGE